MIGAIVGVLLQQNLSKSAATVNGQQGMPKMLIYWHEKQFLFGCKNDIYETIHENNCDSLKQTSS